MADILPPPDVTQFRAFTSGDEDALIRVYRTQYLTLLQQARDALGPPLEHFSGHVAQQAMLATWDHRGRYQTAVGLTAAIEAAIREEAALQRRKHAALHHGDGATAQVPHVVPLSADDAVEHLLNELHAAPVDHDRALLEAQEARRQHAAQHVQSVGQRRGWVIPALLVVVIGAGIIVFMRSVSSHGGESGATKALLADDARNIRSERGQRGNVTLSDGSTARIGSDSRLRVPADFGGLVRTLELHGTAVFTVAAGRPLPFTVRAGNAVITATGTAFAVRAFDEDSAVVVAVDEGSVSVNAKDQTAHTSVTAGAALRMAPDGSVRMLDDAARAQALSWTRDTLVFVNTPLKVVLPELVRWFDLKASLADATLGDRPVTMRVGLKSSGEALDSLAVAAHLAMGFDKDDKVRLSDAVAAPAASPRKRRK